MHVSIGAVNDDQLVACDGCGAVAVFALAPAWRKFTGRVDTGMTIQMHHCERCVAYNDQVTHGIVYGVPAETAVVYD